MSFSVLSLSHLPYCQFTANLLQLGMVEAGPSTAREKREERNAYTRSQNSEICEVIHEIEDFSGEIHKDTKSQVAFSTSPRFCSFPKFSPTESFSFLSHNTQPSRRQPRVVSRSSMYSLLRGRLDDPRKIRCDLLGGTCGFNNSTCFSPIRS